MAALAVVAASVRINDGSRGRQAIGGEAFTQGKVLRLVNSKYYVADKNTLAGAEASAIALTPCTADGQRVTVLELNTEVFVGVAVTKGLAYYLGNTGDIVPVADVVSGDYVTIVGVGGSNQNIHLAFFVSGESVP